MTAEDRIAVLRALLPQCLVADRLWALPRLEQAEARRASNQPADRLLASINERLQGSLEACGRRAAVSLTIDYPDLPVCARREEIVESLLRSQVLVLTGETGSGKTTQLPKMLVEAGCGRCGMIALTQPRRVAAVAMAGRIRAECQAGEGVVVHSVRFDDHIAPQTMIRVMTDGLLLAEAARDADLSRYDAIMIDEAHERSLNIDLLLGLLSQLLLRRPDLKLVISSASIDAERFAAHMGSGSGPAPIIAVSGRTHPVEIIYQPPADDDVGYLDAALRAIRELHAAPQQGDVLCFLPTERDILEARRQLAELAGATMVPLFGRLSAGEQQRVFATSRLRKVVLASNIAETSLTIPGIRYVVDTGLARVKRYQAGTRTERLPVEAVAQASCIQRAGRAGRVAAGVCIRLYSAEDFAARPPFTPPEIMRSNLAGVALRCLGMALGEPEQFAWLDAPSSHAWQQARQILDELGALERPEAAPEMVGAHRPPTAHGRPAAGVQLTALGRHLSAIPADPQVGRILLAGLDLGVVHEACTIAAFLSVQDPRVRPLGQEAKADAVHRALAHEAGDLATVLRIWDRYHQAASRSAKSRFCDHAMMSLRRMREWSDVRHQLWQALRERAASAPLPASGHPSEQWPLDAVHRAVLSGMLGNVLMYDRKERVYRGSGDRKLVVHPGSALRSGKQDDGKRAPPAASWLVACEIVETSRLFARMCAPIDPEWVVSLAGDRVKRKHRDPHYHAGRRQVVCLETVTWKGLPVRDGRLVPYERIDAQAASAIFVSQALVGGALDGSVPWLEANRRVIELAVSLRARLRDPALTCDDAQLESFYRLRLGLDGPYPPAIASSDALLRHCSGENRERLRLTIGELVPAGLAERALSDFPDQVTMGGCTFALRYRFAPGEPDDGVTLLVGDEQLPALDPGRLDGLIPGQLDELVLAYLEQLPKEARRRLIPLAGSARQLGDALRAAGNRMPVSRSLAQAVHATHGLSVRFDPASLPAHLRLRLHITTAAGALLYEGRDGAAFAEQGIGAGDRLLALRTAWQTAPAAIWPGPCPLEVELHGVTAQVVLERTRDEHGAVAARRSVHAGGAAAAIIHEDGLDALLEAAASAQLDVIALAPAARALQERCERSLGMRLGALRRGLALAVLLEVPRRVVRDEAAFAALRADAERALAQAGAGFDELVATASSAMEQLKERLRQGAKSPAQAAILRLAGRHLELLAGPGWLGRLGWGGLRRLGAYLEGIMHAISSALSRPQEAVRRLGRADELIELWQEAIGQHDPRLLHALGLARRVRQLGAVREECLLALGGRSPGHDGAEQPRLRQGISEVVAALEAAMATRQRLRERLQELRPRLRTAMAGPAVSRLAAACDIVQAGIDDVGIGWDLDAVQVRVARLAEQVALLAASR